MLLPYRRERCRETPIKQQARCQKKIFTYDKNVYRVNALDYTRHGGIRLNCGDLVLRRQKRLKEKRDQQRDAIVLMTRVVEDCKLTGHKAAHIIHRSFRVVRFLMIVREEPRVLYISAAIESQEETRARFPKAHEHEKRASGPGSSTCEGTGPVDSLARCRRHSRCSSVHLPVHLAALGSHLPVRSHPDSDHRRTACSRGTILSRCRNHKESAAFSYGPAGILKPSNVTDGESPRLCLIC